MQQKRPAEAVKELERLVNGDSEDRLARTALVAGYLLTDRGKDAEALLERVLKKNPRDVDALIQRSEMSLRSEEHTSELQSRRDLHSFPTRRSSDLCSRNVPLRRSRNWNGW